MIGFNDGSEMRAFLDGHFVENINSDLTSGADLTVAIRLAENAQIAFVADVKAGAFDIEEHLAQRMLSQPNPDGRSNANVVRPWVNGDDITGRPREIWIVDFPPGTPLEEAQLYEAPFEYVARHVQPTRAKTRRKSYRERWWMHVEPGRGMRGGH